jgi:multiple sugar transport system ATP-binding protein
MASVHIDAIDIVLGGVPILKQLSLAIADGEFLVLLGPSGCGKSTLLHTLAGFNEVADGSIRIGGRDVTWADPKDRDIGMVFQSYALYPTMNVERNMSFGLRVAGVPRDEIRRRIDRVAQMLQLGELLARRPAQLSGGQRQRVAIGRALVRDAKVYLFDEPLSNLDAKLRAELRRELKQLHAALGATMVYVTHDQVEAMTLADRIAVMKAGEIQQLGTPQDIYQRPVNLFVAGFLGSPSMNLLRGRLAGQGGGWRFEADTLSAALEGYAFRDTPQQGQAAVLGLRPESLRIGRDVDAFTPHAGLLKVVEPLGAQNIVWFESGGLMLSGIVDAAWEGVPGQRIAFGFDAARASVFDANTERRL